MKNFALFYRQQVRLLAVKLQTNNFYNPFNIKVECCGIRVVSFHVVSFHAKVLSFYKKSCFVPHHRKVLN